MSWTDAKIDTLRRLWTQGKTANQISNMLGVTRNAVIGKAHRLDLTKRPSPIKYGIDTREFDNLPEPRRHRAKPRRLAPRPHRESDSRASLPKLAPVPWLAKRVLAIGTCCWTDCNHAPWVFCGAASVNGSSWCADHHARVFQPRAAIR